MHITHLTYDEINRKKWDACIRNSLNGLIYAETVYLDHMAANWDGLVLGDYEAVMPLTWKKKWGITYLYQPAFFQQGGIFSAKKLNKSTITGFIRKASTSFRFAEITMNYMNEPVQEKGLQIKQRNNFILQLGKGYEHLYSRYDDYIKQRLKRLSKFSLQYKKDDDITGAIKLYRKLYAERMQTATISDFSHFEKLCKHLHANKRVVVRHAYHNDGEELLATILLLKDDKRLYNIISCILPKGKKLLANYFLYDAVFKEFATEDLLFDFEGSDIPGVAYFYHKFADKNQPYSFIKFNNLPLPVRLLKK